MRQINPPSFPKPASNYSQGIVHKLGGERLLLSGQVGVDGQGRAVPGLGAQMKQAWANFLAVLAEAGFKPEHVVKVTIYVTQPALSEFRREREAALAGCAPAATYVQVAALASPDFLVEIEGEAIKP
jgi:enamine deaminase RidA (YjgF/YER057c/UK114 family)